MEWLQSALSEEPFFLFVSILIMVMVSVFAFAARKAHINHIKRMKKIDETFNPKENFNR